MQETVLITGSPLIKKKGFTLIELLVVVAIISILTAIGITGYKKYSYIAAKSTTEQNFFNTVKYMEAEIAKCDLNPRAVAFGLPCPVKLSDVRYQECAAVYLSWQYNIRNPLATKEASGWTASRYCPTKVYGDWRGGVRSGDGQLNGDVNIVMCPRNPYCSNNSKTNGKFKVMWWWEDNMMDSRILAVN